METRNNESVSYCTASGSNKKVRNTPAGFAAGSHENLLIRLSFATRLLFEIDRDLRDFIEGGHDFRVGLEAALRHNERRKFLGDIDVG